MRVLFCMITPPLCLRHRSSLALRNVLTQRDSVCTAAIRTIRGFKNSRWDWNGVINIDTQEDQAMIAPQWGMVPSPLLWPQMQARLAAHNTRLQHRIDTLEPVGGIRLSQREFDVNSDEKYEQLVRHWDAVPQVGGFFMRDSHGNQHTMHVMN
ncbi:hypothetical protein F4679DRAFT_274987 [Xylaria curta]|nr:hypothetical protein F4679DRAFT_274987 [Xylaria curta]